MLSRIRDSSATALTFHALLLAVVWWVISEGDASGWWFGLASVLVALAVDVAFWKGGRLPRVRPLGLVRFLGHFLVGSLQGGIDVARRALSRRLPLVPGFVCYELRARGRAAHHLFMMVVSVMPGTLSVQLSGRTLQLHVLVDRGPELQQQLRALEDRVAAAVGDDTGAAR